VAYVQPYLTGIPGGLRFLYDPNIQDLTPAVIAENRLASDPANLAIQKQQLDAAVASGAIKLEDDPISLDPIFNVGPHISGQRFDQLTDATIIAVAATMTAGVGAAVAGGGEVAPVVADTAPEDAAVGSSAAPTVASGSEISPEMADATASTATGSGASTADTLNAEQAFVQGAAQTGGGSILSTLGAAGSAASAVTAIERLAAGSPKAAPTTAQPASLGSVYFLPGAESSAPSFYSPGSAGPSQAGATSGSTLQQIAIGVALALGLGWFFMNGSA
jgi:hypothetical protein